MKKMKWVIVLTVFVLGTFASSLALAAPLFTFNVPVNLVNIPGSVGPLEIVVNLEDKNKLIIARTTVAPPELNVTSGIINFNKTVTVTFSVSQLNGHNPEDVINYRVGICRAPYGKMLGDLMAANGPTPYDPTKPFNPWTEALPVH